MLVTAFLSLDLTGVGLPNTYVTVENEADGDLRAIDAFDFIFHARCAVRPVLVSVGHVHQALTEALLPALDDAFNHATCPIKGVLLTNPNNPIGQCYPKSVIEGCLRFCQRRNIHFISDEIYALTRHVCPEIRDPTAHLSTLSVPVNDLGCDLSRVHLLWSTSKDFGQNGVRMVSHCKVSPSGIVH